MEFKDKLKKLRSEKGITQETLASTVLVSRSTVAKWENGLSLPNEQSLELLAEYFSIEKSDLLNDKNIENAFVQKNIKISQITKLLLAITAICVVLVVGFLIFLFSFWARPIGGDGGVIGSDFLGINAIISENENSNPNDLKDNQTSIENHYKLQVGKEYCFNVKAIVIGDVDKTLDAEQITIYFDDETISLVHIDNTNKPDYYLKINRKCKYVLMFVEGYNFTYSLVISAE